MNRHILIIFIIICVVPKVCSQNYTIAGKVISSKDNSPIEYATISLSDNDLWAISNDKGEFAIRNVPAGKKQLTAYIIGFAKTTLEIDIKKDTLGLILSLKQDNLSLNEVVVTAQQKTNNLTTSYAMDRTTLDHAQILNITDITSLLPGGKSRGDLSLATSDNRFALRSSTSEKGNASFGTAIEIDGVRLQNNSVFDETLSADTRSIGATNIESIEVVTGIPSVEYGDLSNGIVKINTRKGKTPLIVELSTKPHTKQIAVSKGFRLGAKGGVLNTGLEHTKSVSDLASPYTSYDRNNVSLSYSTTFKRADKSQIMFDAGVSGNIGGYNSKADPDAFRETYVKSDDNSVRANIRLKWLLNKSWITNIDLSGSIIHSDKVTETKENKDSSSSQAAIHSKEEGYFIATNYDDDPNAPIIFTPSGYWYQLQYNDSKPISYSGKIKADWVKELSSFTNKIMIGADFTRSGNKGKGIYYDDLRYAPTWREYRYDEIPFMNNIALYAEEKLTLPIIDISTLEILGGIRSDITHISQSEYGTVGNVSPRINAKYTFWKNSDKLVQDLSVYAGWGKAVKLPSFEVLYPSPSYSDKLAFTPYTPANNKTFYAYYTFPVKAIHNPDLKWQYSKQFEVGFEAKIKGTRISVSAFQNKTYNPYIATSVYVPYSYNFTDQKALESVIIPDVDQIYSIDQSTGIVTVKDRNNVHAAQQLNYTTRKDYKSNKMYSNGSTIKRQGIDWIIDFAQIPSLRTSVRLDGNFYYYKGIEESIIASKPSQNMETGDKDNPLVPYQYVGYYVGTSSTSFLGTSASASNGSLSKQVNTNMTITTHIPKIRLILSMKIEASFYNYKRNLSEYSGGDRGFVLQDAEGYINTDKDIYGGDRYVAVYPLYYTTWDDPETKIDFAEKFTWAKENDPVLFRNLSKLVVKSNTNYYFNLNKISAYYSANISLTKEIGNYASISFYATNFINTMARVKNSSNDTEGSLYNSSYIPKFYYGLSLRLKL